MAEVFSQNVYPECVVKNYNRRWFQSNPEKTPFINNEEYGVMESQVIVAYNAALVEDQELAIKNFTVRIVFIPDNPQITIEKEDSIIIETPYTHTTKNA